MAELEPELGLSLLFVQALSHVRLLATLWTVAHQVLQSSTVSQSLLRFMSIESVMLTDHLTLCCPTLLFSLQSFLASGAFLVSRLFASGGQNIGASASTAILPMSTQG